MHNSPSARGGHGDALCILDPGDQRFLAEHVEACLERPFDQRRMVARGRADVHKIELVFG